MTELNDSSRSRKYRNQPQQNVQSQIESRLPEPESYPAEMIIDNAAAGYMATNPELMFNTVYGGGAAYYMDPAESEKIDSSTDAMSFVNVGQIASVFTRSTNSYVNVHKRAGSMESDGVSAEGSDNHMYSVPASRASVDWQHGAEFAVDTDPMEEESYQTLAPHDPKYTLDIMYSQEPKPVPNPYSPEAAVSTNGDSPTSQDFMEHYTTSSVSQPRTFTLASRPSDDPWTHVEPYRVPRYEPGYAAFAPSPGPAAEQEHDELRPSLQIPKDRSREHGSRTTKPSKGKGRQRGWEHAVVQKGGLQLIMNPEEHTSQRGGVRKGKLDPEAAKKARNVRRVTACWNCWMQKVPCSVGKPCDRCKKQFSPSNQVCCRSHFKEYERTLFPDYLHSHFQKRKIESLVNEYTSGFSDTILDIDVSTGESFKPMKLMANVFKPKSWDLLRQHRLATHEEEHSSRLMVQLSAPVGLLGLNTPELKDKCREHIEDMISAPEYVAQVTSGCHSDIPYHILVAAVHYDNSKDVPLVHNVLMLHAINYFMKTLITFSDDAAGRVYQTLQAYDGGAPLKPHLSSRLLNRQIKYAMHKLSKDITVEVLEGLEKSMRSRTKDSWGPSFCAFLVLCLCMENLQIACDIYVVCDMEKCQNDGSTSAYTRKQSYQATQNVDEHPFSQCKRLFHDIYRSHKESNRGAREAGFNPLKSLASNEDNTGLDPAADAMVRSIYSMIRYSYDEIMELAERPPIANLGYPFDAKNIKINGTGRLVAKFLKSFFPDHFWPS